MKMPDGVWIALFFAVSGVLGVLIGRNDKKAREKKMEYFKNIPGMNEKDVQK